MGAILKELTGISEITNKDDLQTVVFELLEKGKFMVPLSERKSKSHKRSFVNEICQLAEWDFAKITLSLEKMIEENAGIKYFRSICGKKEEDSAPHDTQTPKREALKIVKKEDSLITIDPSWDKLYRSEFQHWTWADSRPWVGRLWIELCHYFPRPWDRSIYFDSRIIKLSAGTIIITERQLAKRHHVTRSMIRCLLRRLESDNMITRSQISRSCDEPKTDPAMSPAADPATDPARRKHSAETITVITITNYWRYHKKIEPPNNEEKSTKTLGETLGETQGRPKGDPAMSPHIIEVDNKEKPDITTSPLPPQREITFLDFMESYEANRGRMASYKESKVGDCTSSPEVQNLFKKIMAMFVKASLDDVSAALSKFSDTIRVAGTVVHESRSWVNLKWLSKGIDNCAAIHDPQYRRPIDEERNNGKPKTIERAGRGDLKEHGIEGQEGGDVAELAAISRAQMQKV